MLDTATLAATRPASLVSGGQKVRGQAAGRTRSLQIATRVDVGEAEFDAQPVAAAYLGSALGRGPRT